MEGVRGLGDGWQGDTGSLEAMLGQFPGCGEEGCGPLLPHLSVALSCDCSGRGKFKVTVWGRGGGDHFIRAGRGQLGSWAPRLPLPAAPRRPFCCEGLSGPCSFIYGLCEQFAPCRPAGWVCDAQITHAPVVVRPLQAAG